MTVSSSWRGTTALIVIPSGFTESMRNVDAPMFASAVQRGGTAMGSAPPGQILPTRSTVVTMRSATCTLNGISGIPTVNLPPGAFVALAAMAGMFFSTKSERVAVFL